MSTPRPPQEGTRGTSVLMDRPPRLSLFSSFPWALSAASALPVAPVPELTLRAVEDPKPVPDASTASRFPSAVVFRCRVLKPYGTVGFDKFGLWCSAVGCLPRIKSNISLPIRWF